MRVLRLWKSSAFYINYEECKYEPTYFAKLGAAPFYINYEECKLIKATGFIVVFVGFILTMRNVNLLYRDKLNMVLMVLY